MRKALAGRVPDLSDPWPVKTLILSVSDGKARASVVAASGASLEAAWQKALTDLRAVMKAKKRKGRWLRADWVEEVRPARWGDLRVLLEKTKRNYFRFGLALDSELRFVFTEQELNANAMLYGGNKIANAVLNETNFSRYAKARHPDLPPLEFRDDQPVYILNMRGIFCDEQGEIHSIAPAGRSAGRREVERLTPEAVLELIETASQYLARQVKADGNFVYGTHPCFDREIATYNTLRHASTTYAM